MTGKKKLPIGIDIFEKMDREEFYYVDKTGMIEDLIQNRSEVNLFTRPRRFGKSLNMSMMKAFFEIGASPALFKGLKISERKELCEKYMGQFPVISISLKSVEGLDFEAAKKALKDILGEEAGRFYFLTQSSKLTNEEIESYKALLRVGETGDFLMSDTAMEKALLRCRITYLYRLRCRYRRDCLHSEMHSVCHTDRKNVLSSRCHCEVCFEKDL